MERRFTIGITLDTERGIVTDMDVQEGIYNRTEFLADGIDAPVPIEEAVEMFRDFLMNP